jgi:hypothetical protein
VAVPEKQAAGLGEARFGPRLTLRCEIGTLTPLGSMGTPHGGDGGSARGKNTPTT